MRLFVRFAAAAASAALLVGVSLVYAASPSPVAAGRVSTTRLVPLDAADRSDTADHAQQTSEVSQATQSESSATSGDHASSTSSTRETPESSKTESPEASGDHSGTTTSSPSVGQKVEAAVQAARDGKTENDVPEAVHAVQTDNVENPKGLEIAKAIYGTVSGSTASTSGTSTSTTTALAAFQDLGGTAWANPAIGALAAQHILLGTAPGQFDPSGVVTLDQLVTMIHRLLGHPAATTAASLPAGTPSWADASMAWAVGTKALQGVPLPSDPNAALTREQAIGILLNALGLSPVANGTQASQATIPLTGSIDPWAHGYFSVATALGIVNGSGAQALAHQPLTRAQMAVLLARLSVLEAEAGLPTTSSTSGSSGLGAGPSGLGTGATSPLL